MNDLGLGAPRELDPRLLQLVAAGFVQVGTPDRSADQAPAGQEQVAIVDLAGEAPVGFGEVDRPGRLERARWRIGRRRQSAHFGALDPPDPDQARRLIWRNRDRLHRSEKMLKFAWVCHRSWSFC